MNKTMYRNAFISEPLYNQTPIGPVKKAMQKVESISSQNALIQSADKSPLYSSMNLTNAYEKRHIPNKTIKKMSNGIL